MRVSADEREPLSRAMSVLSEGDSRGFCDSLWLAYGDRWKKVMRELAEHGFVAVLDQECNEGIRITERGRALAANLIKATRQTA